jgi:hypothetical protein
MDNDGRRGNGDHTDRHEIGIRIGQIFQHQAVGNGARRADQEGVAVGRRMGDERCCDHRAGAWPIFDDNRLPKPLAHALGRKSGDQVIRAAGPKSDDPADWMVRPFRTRRRRSEPTNKEASGKNHGPIRAPSLDQLFASTASLHVAP